MGESDTVADPRGMFVERFALLYAEAGDPPLKRVTESVARARRLDEQGQSVRVTPQRISDWRRGRNVPARFAALAAVLEVLVGQAYKIRPRPAVAGLYDLGVWRTLWEKALAAPVVPADNPSAARESAGAGSAQQRSLEEPVVCPYRGLAAFRQEDSDRFFGRDRSTAALVAQLDKAADSGGVVVLVGASGAGKSSLLKAGLIPALSRGAFAAAETTDWPVVMMTPGADPLNELGRHIPELTDILNVTVRTAGTGAGAEDEDTAPGAIGEPSTVPASQLRDEIRRACATHVQRRVGDGARLVLVVDQFEEIFTHCKDEERRSFIHALHAACTFEISGEFAPSIVVIGLRADFYGPCLDYPELAAALQDRQMVLGPMTAGELQDAIISPAKSVGLQLEAGLADLLLRDLGVSSGRTQTRAGQGTYDAGALPLLSHALLATWQRRKAGKLTISGYRATGEIQGAIAATAERAWADLDTAGQVVARSILMRLVRVGEETQDTRRQATRQELREEIGNRAAAEDALEVLTKARLVTLDAGSVEITHEALLRAWPRLRSWIEQDRAAYLARQRLEEDAKAWKIHERDSSLLYRGPRLESARQWAEPGNAFGLTVLARDFLTSSIRHWRRAAWTRRAAVVAVVVFALIAASSAAVAIQKRDEAVFRQVVAEADRLQDTDPSLAAQLALVAHQMRPHDNDIYTRLMSAQNTPLATPLTGHNGAVYLTSFSPGGHLLATASYDQTVRLWDLRDHTHPKPVGNPLVGHTSWVTSAVFSPDGRTLATAGDDKTIRLWNVTDPANPMPLGPPLTGHNGTIYLLAFSPDGRTLATANEDHSSRLWDVHDLRQPVAFGPPLTGHQGQVRSIAFSPDGRTLATAGDDKTIRLWNVTDSANPMPLGPPLTGHTEGIHSVAFSPDGRLLATGSEDNSVRLWNLTDPTNPAPLSPPLTGHNGPVWSVAFSPDGRILATGSSDSTARLWNVSDPARAEPFGQPLAGGTSTVFAVAFSPDGHTLATGSEDGTARLWSLPPTVPAGQPSGTLALSHDGRLLATGGEDNSVRLWNLADPANPARLAPPLTGHTASLWSAAFSPDGRILATGAADQAVRLWNPRDPDHPIIGPPITGHTRYKVLAAFSPDTQLLATTSSDQTVRLWDIRNPANPTPLGQPLTGHRGDVTQAIFSPDGRVLATASRDKTIRLWDIRNPDHPLALGRPLTGHTESVLSVVFSPDGRLLATASSDQSIRLWNVADPAHAAPIGQAITARNGPLYSVAFAAEGHFLAAATRNSVLMLDLSEEHVVQRICATTLGIMTPQQWQQHLPELSYQPPCR